MDFLLYKMLTSSAKQNTSLTWFTLSFCLEAKILASFGLDTKIVALVLA